MPATEQDMLDAVMARDVYIFNLDDPALHRELANPLPAVAEAAAEAARAEVAGWGAAISAGLPTARLLAAEGALGQAERDGAF